MGISRLSTILCLFGWIAAPLTNLQAQFVSPPPPEAITARQGLPQAFVPAIVQDRQGFIWMATLDGLARYDGRQFNVFQPTTSGRPGLSSAGIENLLTDSRGNLWIKSYQGDLDWFDTRQETVVNFSRQPRYQRSVERDTLESYYPDGRNRLWAWFRHKGLFCFDLNGQQVRQYRHQAGRAGSLAGNTVTAVAEDGRGQVWVATTAGLDRLDQRTNTFVLYRPQPGDTTTLPAAPIRVMHRRKNGDLLLVSERQLTLLEHRSGKMHRVALPAPTFQWWRHQLGTDTQGNDYLDWAGHILRIDRPAASPGLTLHTLIRAAPDWRSMGLFVDRSDVLWVGTDATGVRKFNLRANLFASQPYRHSFPVDVLTNVLGVPSAQAARLMLGPVSYNFRATLDQGGRLWFTVGSTPFYRLDRQTGQVTTIPFLTQFKEPESNRPALLATDPGGRVWAVYDSLVCWYNEPTGRWQRFPFPIRRTAQLAGPVSPAQQAGATQNGAASLPSVRQSGTGVTVESPILQLVVDGRALWLITGARGLYRVDRQTGQIRRYAHQPGDSTSLSSNNLYCLFADPTDDNTLWIGTAGSGLCRFDKRSGRCQRFSTKNGLPNNVIYAAIPDRRGYVWIATNRGLCRLDRQTGRTRTYTREDGLSADEFNRFHSLYLPGPVRRGPASRTDSGTDSGSGGTAGQKPSDDRIILGGIEGITTFTPGQLQEDTYQPTVELTGLWLNNRPVEPGPRSPLGNSPVQMVRHLTLPHDQNFLTVAFAGLQFNNPGRLRYRYRLEGIDRDWTLTDQPQAIYTDLSPGTYTLSLNAANTSGQWSRHVRTLTVTINPPWWASWWAYGLYLALAGGLVVAGGRTYLRQREARQQRAVAELKERFFANITHEFRTPLTLILSPVEALLSDLKQTQYGERLALVDRNARQLLGLINQLMDLAKLDAQLMPVTPVRGRPDEVVAHIVQSFTEAAQTSFIQLTYEAENTGQYWFDADKLARIAGNLIGNALKFTPGSAERSGRVTVTLRAEAGLQLVVADTGIGLSAEQLPHLFDRFFQADPPAGAQVADARVAGQPQMGTGIGLALVRELVDLQRGQIRVESQPGRGTTFWVDLPYAPVTDPEPETLATPAPENPPAEPTDTEPAVLLLVEDNDDMARFISQSLPAHYQVHRAVDGLDGLEQARQLMPDLIVSDVMMPRMDGYQLCQRLKTDALTDHIPVILLTAKAALESRMQGLTLGADDYLGKPFHLPELLLRLNNLLATQRRQRERLRTQLVSPALASVTAPEPTPPHPFLQQLYGVLNNHLDEADFGVEELAAEASLSRMQLHRKLKALTDLPTTEFIRTYRLRRALPLLQQGLSVSQTAYAVGFDNPSYFGQCFRELYGQTPSSYSPNQTGKG